MKTGIQMARDTYSALNDSSVTSLLDGSIYLLTRPQNSLKKDVVIATLAILEDFLEKGVVIVNIHCPNIKGVVIGGVTDDTQPDVASFEAITNACMNILNGYTGYDFQLFAQTNGVPLRDQANLMWYINIRVNYISFNKEFQSN